MKEGYLVIDSSSANIRAGVTTVDGELISISSRPIINYRDSLYTDALYFSPDELIEALTNVCREALTSAEDVRIIAVSAASQREGIVALNACGEGLIGLPNIDNRGLEYEDTVDNRHDCYMRAGRWVSTLFPAVKLLAIRDRQPEIYTQIDKFTSISDYIGFFMTGRLVYETSQACETLLFNIQEGAWDPVLCERLGVPAVLLPELAKCGDLLGYVSSEVCSKIGLSAGTPFFVGGADTQMAAESCLPAPGDLVIVAGTTTPIVSILDGYRTDELERCWTNRHVHSGRFVVETNVGASGINYDKIKEILYPNCSYEDMEADIQNCSGEACLASVGSMCFESGKVTPIGGFLVNAPLSAALCRGDFALAVLRDYAYSFKQNYDNAVDIIGADPSRIFGCGNGFSGKILPQMMADLIGRDISVVDGHAHATMTGIHHTIYRVLTGQEVERTVSKSIHARSNPALTMGQSKWYLARELFNTFEVSDFVNG